MYFRLIFRKAKVYLNSLSVKNQHTERSKTPTARS